MTITVTDPESQPFEPNRGQEIVVSQIARQAEGTDVTTARFPFYIKDSRKLRLVCEVYRSIL